jgi:diguanylate cyclase (GGDEF)-like protein
VSTLHRVFAGRLVAPALLITAGLIFATDAQGLVSVLVVLAAAGTAIRSGRRNGIVLAATAGLGFIAVSIWQERAHGIGLPLTAAVVPLWMLIAWAAGATAEELRRLDDQLAGHVHELHHRALHDPLTGLANRDLLLDRLALALQRAERHHTHIAVLFLDLDNFKLINDSLGHAAGDRLLVEVGHRLTAQLRGTDTAARFGGDEFVLVCEDLNDAQESVQIADRITAALRPPFTIEGRNIAVTASIGIAVPASTAHAPDQLLQDADQAMYRAKARGGGRFDVFNDALRDRAIHRLSTEIDLRQAIDRDELRLVYQPIIDLTTDRVSGVEALLRWQHPTRGLLAPAEFLPIAEGSSLIVGIGAWVLEEACAQATRWHSVAKPPLTMAINVSLRQLISGSFDADLTHALEHSGIDPSEIHLEITETTLLAATQSMKDQLVMISGWGISVGLDDFGTGYSSLSLIKDFPVRFLKIDQTFTFGLGHDPDDTAITRAVLGLGRHLDLDTIAEGIETPDQLTRLRQLGCRYGQGYHLARPQSPDHIQQLLDQTAAWHPAGT